MRRLLFVTLLLLAAVIALFFFTRRETQAAFGPAVTLCPGPDRYGYTCENGAAFAYIDATNDTGLYEDDGATTLPLPFPFTFYGTSYSEVQATSNGTLHFGQTGLQYNNPVVADASALHLRHPAGANEAVGQQATPAGLVEAARPAAKGEVARAGSLRLERA